MRFLQVGVINAMRTGNVVLDMMIAMSIPLALQAFFKFWEWLKPRVEEFLLSFQRQEFYYERSIDHEKVRAWDWRQRKVSSMYLRDFAILPSKDR